MKTKKKEKDYKPFYAIAAILVFLLPFAVGYMRLKLLLSGLDIFLIPSEVYGLSYVYFSGCKFRSNPPPDSD